MVSKYIFELYLEYLDEAQRARFIADEIADLEREWRKLIHDNDNSE